MRKGKDIGGIIRVMGRRTKRNFDEMLGERRRDEDTDGSGRYALRRNG